MEKYLEELKKQFSNFCLDDLFVPTKCVWFNENKKNNNNIRSILANKDKNVLTVVFEDGSSEVIRCNGKDDFDINVGVALAITQHLYGSKTKFHKEIASKIKIKEKKD